MSRHVLRGRDDWLGDVGQLGPIRGWGLGLVLRRGEGDRSAFDKIGIGG